MKLVKLRSGKVQTNISFIVWVTSPLKQVTQSSYFHQALKNKRILSSYSCNVYITSACSASVVWLATFLYRLFHVKDYKLFVDHHFLLAKLLVSSPSGAESNGKLGSWTVLINLENRSYITDSTVMIDVFSPTLLYTATGIAGLPLLVKFIIPVIPTITCNFSSNWYFIT